VVHGKTVFDYHCVVTVCGREKAERTCTDEVLGIALHLDRRLD
jgi:hypothetical protein